MNSDIKKRIEQINSRQVPEGYKKEHGFIAPKEWDIPALSKIVKPASRPVNKPEEGYWRLGIRSHAKGTFHTFVEKPKTVAMDELYEVKENDLILNITFAWEHAIAIANKEDDGKLVSHRFPTYEFKPDSVADFYKYIIVQPRLKYMLSNISPGGAGRNRVLNKTDFLKLNLPKPTQKEQQNIAEILATCDRVIELKEDLLTEKQNQKKWLMQKLLTGEIRLKGFSEEWKEYKLGDIFKITAGGDFKPSLSSYNKSEEHRYPVYSNALSNEGLYAYSNYYTNNSNTITVTARGTIGFALARDHKYTAIGRLLVLTPKIELNCHYIAEYINSNINFVLESTGVTQLTAPKIASYKIVLSSIEEQKTIAEILSTADKELDLIQKEIDEYKQLKKSLMQLLLTGVVRVNELKINTRPQEKQEAQAC